MYHFTIPPRTTQSRLASRNLANQSSGFSQQPHTHVPSPPLSFQIEIVFWSCAKHKKWRITIEAIFFYRFFHLTAHVLALFRSSSSERKTIFTISKFFNIKNNLSLLSSPSSSFALANSKYVFARCFAWSPPAAAQLSHSMCSSEKSFEKRRVKISLQMSDIPSIIFEEFLSRVFVQILQNWTIFFAAAAEFEVFEYFEYCGSSSETHNDEVVEKKQRKSKNSILLLLFRNNFQFLDICVFVFMCIFRHSGNETNDRLIVQRHHPLSFSISTKDEWETDNWKTIREKITYCMNHNISISNNFKTPSALEDSVSWLCYLHFYSLVDRLLCGRVGLRCRQNCKDDDVSRQDINFFLSY